ncbi:MAG: ComF family protein [Clostridia bacterium]|nr:ComF family protein [Clostridia bacterium]
MNNSVWIACLYPNKCAACGEIIEENKVLCDYCSIVVNNIDFRSFCTKCGLDKDGCRCKFREFRFKGIAGAYKNEGTAKTVYYSYKMNKRTELASFFAKSVAATVKRVFRGVKFDAVCSVPTSLRSKFRHGFDHTDIIASKLADELGVKYLTGILRVRAFKRPQHGSSSVKRLENVMDKYYTVERIKEKRILLFDDIYTTGSTLDEVTKELMFAGAYEVYCVSVLTTSLNKFGEGNNGN